MSDEARTTRSIRAVPAKAAAAVGGVIAIAALFAPWMGVKYPLDDVASGRPMYWGRALQDHTAVKISLKLSLVMVAAGLTVLVVGLTGVAGKTIVGERVASWVLIGSGLMIAAGTYLLVYAVTGSPFKGGASPDGFFHWGPLFGPKLEAVCAAMISGAGVLGVRSAKRSDNR